MDTDLTYNEYVLMNRQRISPNLIAYLILMVVGVVAIVSLAVNFNSFSTENRSKASESNDLVRFELEGQTKDLLVGQATRLKLYLTQIAGKKFDGFQYSIQVPTGEAIELTSQSSPEILGMTEVFSNFESGFWQQAWITSNPTTPFQATESSLLLAEFEVTLLREGDFDLIFLPTNTDDFQVNTGTIVSKAIEHQTGDNLLADGQTITLISKSDPDSGGIPNQPSPTPLPTPSPTTTPTPTPVLVAPRPSLSPTTNPSPTATPLLEPSPTPDIISDRDLEQIPEPARNRIKTAIQRIFNRFERLFTKLNFRR